MFSRIEYRAFVIELQDHECRIYWPDGRHAGFKKTIEASRQFIDACRSDK